MILILLLSQKTVIYIIDSTTIKACQNKRRMNMVFNGKAKNSKTSMGCFYGFKLHIMINNKDEIIFTKIYP